LLGEWNFGGYNRLDMGLGRVKLGMHREFLFWNILENVNLEDSEGNGRITLKLFLEK
jgi:hypothetical protein